jgi:hypothetical protein
MTALSTTELAKMRDSWDNWLYDTCTITRSVVTQGDYGETEADADVHVGVKCSMTEAVLPGVQQIIAERQSRVADSMISFPFGTDVLISDVLTVTSQGNRRFEVIYVGAPSFLASGVQAYCREVK